MPAPRGYPIRPVLIATAHHARTYGEAVQSNEADRTTFPGVAATTDLGPDGQNQTVFSVMSYNRGLGRQLPNAQNIDVVNYGNQAGLGAFDIRALQLLYGAKANNAGGDTYYLPQANAAGTGWSTIWDTDGIDTIANADPVTHEVSNQDCSIDLRNAPLTGRFAGGYVSQVITFGGRNIEGGFTVAYDDPLDVFTALIENAIGGNGADSFVGNAANNKLDGGAGIDWVNYSGNRADYLVQQVNGSTWTVKDLRPGSLDGTDTLLNIEHILFRDTELALTGGVTIEQNSEGGSDIYISKPEDLPNNFGTPFHDRVFIGGPGSYQLPSLVEEAVSIGSAKDNVTANDLANVMSVSEAGGQASPGVSFLGRGGNDTLKGGSGADMLDGGDGDDVLIGLGGINILKGGRGDDTYYVSSSTDKITEVAGQGFDLVIAYASYTLAANVEELELAEGSAINAVGNAGKNAIFGNSVANLIDGGAGNDTIVGGAGDDTLRGGTGIDTVSYAAAASDISIDLALLTPQADGDGGMDTLSGFENIVGSAFADTLTGDKNANVIEGGGDSDTLEGGLGSDTLSYAGSAAGVTVTLVKSGQAIVSGGDADGDIATGFENITGSAHDDVLTGDGDANVLTGLAGNDTLDGKGGIDTLVGGLGDDVYVLDQIADKVIELVGEGTDTVRIAATYVLGANVENLELQGGGDFNGTGNALANSITGTSGKNTIDGAGGADTLIGGAGDDTYVVDNTGDAVWELLDEGTDTVLASASFALSDNVENLTLNGTASINALGNALANVIKGNSGANVIEGGGAGDTLDGGAGLDTLSYAGSSAGVHVTLMGAKAEAIVSGGDADGDHAIGFEAILGSAYADELTGDGGKNTLDGGDDSVLDVLVGGFGDDVYILRGTVQDQVVENAGEGSKDTVWSYMTSAALADYVENGAVKGNGGALTGNGLANVLTGSDGDDTLDGGVDSDAKFADQLKGGKGNDTYIIRDVKDKITEGAKDGVDTVETALSTYTLATTLENLSFTGSDSHVGKGNKSDNKLTGGDGADRLEGLDGADVLLGGLGSDTLIGGNGADVLTGGGDADIFVLDGKLVAGVFDEITDFNASEGDLISLKKSVFTGLGGSDNRFLTTAEFFSTSNFLLDQTGLSAQNRIIYDQATGQLFYDKDGLGSAAAMQIALIDGAPSLDAANIMVGFAS